MAAEDIDCSDFFDGPGKRKRSPAAAVATVMQLLKGDSMNMGKEPVSLFRPDDNVGNVLKQEYMPEEQMLVSSIRQELHMPEPPVPPTTSTVINEDESPDFHSGFQNGFSQGFIAGLFYKQNEISASLNLGIKADAEGVPGVSGQMMARLMSQGNRINCSRSKASKTSPVPTRRPYRFCVKCWITSKTWVLKSIKLPNGSIAHLHPEVCSAWEGDAEPTKDQFRIYGAAYKRAQRSSALHDVALKAFKAAMPDVEEEKLHDYLMS